MLLSCSILNDRFTFEPVRDAGDAALPDGGAQQPDGGAQQDGGPEAPLLTALELSAGILSPAFSPSVTSYTVDLRLFDSTLRVTPSAEADAIITVEGVQVPSGSPSDALPLGLGANTIAIVVSGIGGMRTYTVTAIRGAAVDYLKASDVGTRDSFGISVAISGDTLIVGAHFEASSTRGINTTPNDDAPNSGAVYVFVRTASTWVQQAYIKSSNSGALDNFGYSVAISGDTLVVGAPFEDSSSAGVNSVPNEDGNSAGAAYVFVRSGETWTQQAYIKPLNTGAQDNFGISVAISGETIAVGAQRESSSTTTINSTPNDLALDSGAAYVFVRSGTAWTQQAYIKPSNTGAGDYFGRRLGMGMQSTRLVLVVGAPYEDSSTNTINSSSNEALMDSGAAYAFTRSGSTWAQEAYIKPPDPSAGANFGLSFAFASNSYVAVGSPAADTGAGAVHVFSTSGGAWNPLGAGVVRASTGAPDDQFGASVALSGTADTLFVGAPGRDGSRGIVYMYSRPVASASWTQLGSIQHPIADAEDRFGYSLALSVDTLIVGALGEDSSTQGVNTIPNESATESGAAYVF